MRLNRALVALGLAVVLGVGVSLAVEAEDPAPALPSYFGEANPEHAARLALIVEDARRSRTGRRVLRQVEEMTRRRSRPVILEFASMRAANMYVDWDAEIVRISKWFLRKDLHKAAPYFVHELVHV